MDVGRLLRRRQALRIGHRREVAVIGIADPARARQIGAVFAGAAAAQHRLAGGRDDIGIEAVAVGREALPVEFGIALGARAEAVIGESCSDGHRRRSCGRRAGLRHRMPPWHSASAFSCGRNSFSTKFDTAASRCGCGVEGGMNVEAGASAGAGRAAIRQRRVGVGGVDHPRQVADQRLQRLAQFCKALRQVARHRRAGVVDRGHHAAAPEQRALGRRVDDHVGDEARRNRCRWRRSTAAPDRACDRAGGVWRR